MRPSVLRRTRTVGLFAALLAPAVPSAADDALLEPDADVVSELGLARAAEALGDVALGQRIAANGPREQTLVAVRASSYARAPELLVPALAQLACGRDPALAPEATYALLAIAERLRPSELAARETLLSDLRAARDALACSERPPRPRADLALALRRVDAALEALSR